VLDENGFSKGFGFIRFSNEVEQQTAMSGMNGMAGLGGKPIKVIPDMELLQTTTGQVSVAVNKIKDGMATPQVPDHISQAVAHSVVGEERRVDLITCHTSHQGPRPAQA
jgi:RNA recognition motif-containing protein